MDRRQFISKTASSSAALTIVPRHVLGGVGFLSPSGVINVGYIGAGTQGIRQLMQALGRPELRVTSICDPNKDSCDYVKWSKNELRDRIRGFLGNSEWGEGARDAVADVK